MFEYSKENNTIKIDYSLRGGEEIHLELKENAGAVGSCEWQVIGDQNFIESVRNFAETKMPEGALLKDVKLPTGRTTAELMMIKLLKVLQGELLVEPDYNLCHCRKVSEAQVEKAIVHGAHDLESVRRMSSANTGCGTCLSDIQDLFERYQL